MSRVLHRSFSSGLPTAVRGIGPYIFDQDGRRYLDASGGAAVSCLGHSHPRVIRAIVDQVQALPFAHTSFFTSEPMERLADFLVTRAPAGISKVGIVCGGSEAVEAALKLARQYRIERDEPDRVYFVSRRLSYHGNTLGALSVGGNLARRRPYAPYLSDKVELIAPCYAYRYQQKGESEVAYGLRVANELEEAIERLGADQVSAFIAEPIVGATAGCLTPVPGYFKRIREICDHYGVLFIADEIMCGMGRTGTLFACEQEGVAPDIITVAKGLGAGYQPIGAILASEKIVGAIERGSRTLAHGHTYMGHTIACAAALAVQETIEEEDLLANVRRMGGVLESRLREDLGRHPYIGDIRGRGLFWALELVQDRAHKKPFDPRLALHARLKREAMLRGLICYPSGSSEAGSSEAGSSEAGSGADPGCGDHILLAPPYIIGESHIDEIIRALSGTLDAVLPALEKATMA